MPLAVDVLLPVPVPRLRFLAPLGRDAGPAGARVAVPWQGGVRLGVVAALASVDAARASELKEALDWLDTQPFLALERIEWIEAQAQRQAVPVGLALADLVPAGLREAVRHEVRAVPGTLGDAPTDWTDATALPPGHVDRWRETGLIEERVELPPPTARRIESVASGEAGLEGAARANQRRALAHLREAGAFESGAAWARSADVPASAVRALLRKGHAAYRERPLPPPELPSLPAPRPLPGGGAEAPRGHAVGLEGGRRATRLAALVPRLREDVAAGGSVLVLVPERYLVEETAAALAAAGLPVRVHPSGMEEPLRHRVAEDLRAGPRVLVGTYPALTAPLRATARVAVLEAGSDSYKLPSGTRLVVPEAAADLALRLAADLVLTDGLLGPEERALLDGGERLVLPRPRRRWHVTDLEATRGWPLSADLVRVLRQVRDRDRQALLLAGRRGYSAALGCRDCRWSAMCPNCSLTLRYHQRQRRLRCHQCGHDQAPPEHCPACGGTDLAAQRAAGSEWVAQAAAEAAPALAVYRFDADRRDDLAPLEAGRPGVLVGTQAALRLPPLPRLSLIGVVLLDGLLHLDDFRAEERTARTLFATGELAPERPPLTLLQTFHPEHPLLAAVTRGDEAAVEAFVAEQDARRRRFGYPPYGRLARVQITARKTGRAQRAADEAAARLRTAGAGDAELLGPAPAPVSRVRGRDVMQLLLRAQDDARLAWLLERLDAHASGVQVRVDVHPRDVGAWLD